MGDVGEREDFGCCGWDVIAMRIDFWNLYHNVSRIESSEASLLSKVFILDGIYTKPSNQPFGATKNQSQLPVEVTYVLRSGLANDVC